MANATLYPQAQQPRGITPEMMQHFYAGVITRALEANRLRPIVAPAYDGPQLTTVRIFLPIGVTKRNPPIYSA